MKPNNNKIANMNYNKLVPANDVKTHLRKAVTPRKGNVQETTHPPMGKCMKPSRRNYTSKTMTSKFIYSTIL